MSACSICGSPVLCLLPSLLRGQLVGVHMVPGDVKFVLPEASSDQRDIDLVETQPIAVLGQAPWCSTKTAPVIHRADLPIGL